MKRLNLLTCGLTLVLFASCRDSPLGLTVDSALRTVSALPFGVTSIDGPEEPAAVNTPVQITAHFTGGVEDIHTAVIRWGDGASSVATVAEENGAGSATATRSYVLPGVYTVEVEISNQAVESFRHTFEYVVVYNPDGGYVSGNGTIVSPEGACTWGGCVSDEGIARFGASSRYRSGAHVPDGNTRFVFRDGNFTFDSSEYEWLVISGARAQYKGVGTVNRQGNYGFMLTAIDSDRPGGGEHDRVRLKVWDRDNGDEIVYDNQRSTADDAALADGTQLTRGRITIRSTTRNEPPVVVITSPADGRTLSETEAIRLAAAAGDPEDGDISDQVTWNSDIGGPLGTGAELTDVRLGPGEHTITASVSDSEGLEASASVVVSITEVFYTISISPTEATIDQGESQQFAATVYADGVELVENVPDLHWTSDNEAVATIDQGVATGGNAGEAKISVHLANDPEVATEALLVVRSAVLLLETVSTMNSTTCALTGSGAAYCWGMNTYGNIGDGTTTHRSVPTAVSGSHVFTSVAAGYYHTCGLTVEGAAYCWGRTQYGQLGQGTGSDGVIPVPTAVNTSEIFVSISAGENFTCALTAEGAAFCWGRNFQGNLGDGTGTSRSTPTAVIGSHVFTSITTGNWHTCALGADGAAYCWGSQSTSGNLGTGSWSHEAAPAPVSTPERFTSISAGNSATCALRSDGAAYCWGSAVGDGTTTARPVPTAVSGSHVFTSIDVGRTSRCAVRSDGAAYCWGNSNFYGHFGDGTTEPRLEPTAVSGSHVFTSITTGYWHTCAVRADHNVYCWGLNSIGQLGNGTDTTSYTPVAVAN
jgi:alpha-tubulin suppressor-like RCC1 family protein